MIDRNEVRALREALSALFLLPATIALLLCGLLYDRSAPLDYSPPSVEEEATLEPYTPLPVAIPVDAMTEAVAMVGSGVPVRRAAREWGVSESTLRRRVARLTATAA